MGSCFSKKTVASYSLTPVSNPPILIEFGKRKAHEEGSCKKTLFAINYKMSHEIDCNHSKEDNKTITPTISDRGCGVRTSSCTKEEVDAILIQCGRLSNSSSSIQGSRKFSGSKRSFEFDNEDGDQDQGNVSIVVDGDAEETTSDRIRGHRQRHRDGSSSPRGRRRRTLSRERCGGNGSGERRMSRSPGRRSESPTTCHKLLSGNVDKPGKLVSVPATVSCNKSRNGSHGGVVGTPSADAIKKVQVKRTVSSPRAQSPARTIVMAHSNEVHRTVASTRAQSPARTTVMVTLNKSQRTVASPRAQSPAWTNVKAFPNEVQRTAASPRAKSPARTNVKVASIESQWTAASPSVRSPARTNAKATSNEVQRTAALPRAQSQTKTNATAFSNEIQNSFSGRYSRKNDQSPYRRNPLCEIDTGITMHKHSSSKVINQAAMIQKSCAVEQGIEDKGSTNRSRKEQQKQLSEEAKELNGNVLINSQSLTRSGLPKPSPGLTNSETSLKSSYATLLLEDIQNFHQKTAPAAAYSVPACVTKARSIVDAVADLNSSTKAHAIAKERTRNPKAQKCKKNEKSSSVGANVVESKVAVSNDLMEPINETFTSM
ncbi:uncharacterized protein At1g65710-like [Apium graveolens]|uniref:uncharacterized protein At1g65710-like n=1 Tax=Apium graveolens TaxID=4045 RepID=UPI003D7B597A